MKILSKFVQFFSRREEKRIPYTYFMGGEWGNKIGVIGNRVYGFKQRIPEVGDYLEGETAKGGYARFEFINVERCSDPPDMFFADVILIKYLKEPRVN
jgi:hypothetical protein